MLRVPGVGCSQAIRACCAETSTERTSSGLLVACSLVRSGFPNMVARRRALPINLDHVSVGRVFRSRKLPVFVAQAFVLGRVPLPRDVRELV